MSYIMLAGPFGVPVPEPPPKEVLRGCFFRRLAFCMGLLFAGQGCAQRFALPSGGAERQKAALLVDELRSSDPAVWVPAGLSLEKMDGTAPIAGLCALFEDERQSLEVRSRAGIVLTNIGAPASTPLSKLLGRVSSEVPLAAAKILGELGETSAVPPLVSFLREPRGIVEAIRAREQERLPGKEVVSQPKEKIEEFREAFGGEGKSRIAEAEAAGRAIAAQALGRLKTPTTSRHLAAVLADRGAATEARASAAAVLGALRDHGSVPLLLRALKDDHPVVRAGAAKALGDIGDLRAVSPLTVSVRDADVRVRKEVASALGKIASPSALKALVTAVLDEQEGETTAWLSMIQTLEVTGRSLPLHLLLDALRSEDSGVRRAAARILAQIRFVDKALLLAEYVSASFADPSIRKSAAEQLVTKRFERAETPLPGIFASGDDGRRLDRVTTVLAKGWVSEKQVLLELAAAGKQVTADDLLAELDSPDRERQMAAAVKAGLLGEAARSAIGRLIELLAVQYKSRTAWGGLADLQEYAADALVRIGPAAIAPLVAALADREKAGSAARALGDLKDPAAVEPLIDLMANGEPVTAEKAAAALGQIRFPRTAKRLAEIVSNPSLSTQARRSAAEALGWHGDPQGVEPLINALRKDGAEVRIAAATALGRLRDLRAIEPLAQAMATDSQELRLKIVAALGGIRGAKALAVLAAALGRDPSPDVRAGIINALFVPAWFEGRPIPIGPFLAGLADDNPTVRDAAAERLALIPDERKVEAVISLLHRSQVDLSAVHALGMIRDPRALPALVKILEAPNPPLRRAAAEALGALQDPRAVEALCGLLQGGDRVLAATAAGSLGLIGDKRAEAPLLEAIERSDLDMGPEFPWAFLRINRMPGVEFHVASLKISSFQAQAIEALARIGEPAEFLVISALTDANPVRRAGAARALGRLGTPRATPVLIKALDDPDARVRAGALEALVHITGEDFGTSGEKWLRWWEGPGKN